jgi:uncharacterized protein YlxW (UPF0749 family)
MTDWGSAVVGFLSASLVAALGVMLQQRAAKRDAEQKRALDMAELLGALREAVRTLQQGLADVSDRVERVAGDVSSLRATVSSHTRSEEAHWEDARRAMGG